MKASKKLYLAAIATLCTLPSLNAVAQIITPQPIVFSQTVIAIVPGNAVPKTISQSPMLQTPLDSAGRESEETTATEDSGGGNEASPAEDLIFTPEVKPKGASDDAKASLKANALAPEMTLRVKVRGQQIPMNQGLITNYRLDTEHGVLTYFPTAEPREMIAENIQEPLDILFIREDGVIAQLMPEVIPAYLPQSVEVDFPLRALLYIQAGLAETLGISPGFRIEHGMFKPKPLIYTAPKEMAESSIHHLIIRHGTHQFEYLIT